MDGPEVDRQELISLTPSHKPALEGSCADGCIDSRSCAETQLDKETTSMEFKDKAPKSRSLEDEHQIC